MQASKIAKFLVLSVLFTLSFSVQAQEHHEEKEGFKKGDPIDTKEEIKKYIDHHLLDSYDFTFWSDSETGEHMSFPLPVILFDNGVHIFSSSKFILVGFLYRGENKSINEPLMQNSPGLKTVETLSYPFFCNLCPIFCIENNSPTLRVKLSSSKYFRGGSFHRRLAALNTNTSIFPFSS